MLVVFTIGIQIKFAAKSFNVNKYRETYIH